MVCHPCASLTTGAGLGLDDLVTLGGRGFGKTRTIVEWAKRQAQQMPGSRGAIVAATAADARDILVEGESGFLATGTEITYEPSKRRITFANGSRASLV